jgi:hypothetical protein
MASGDQEVLRSPASLAGFAVKLIDVTAFVELFQKRDIDELFRSAVFGLGIFLCQRLQDQLNALERRIGLGRHELKPRFRVSLFDLLVVGVAEKMLQYPEGVFFFVFYKSESHRQRI